MMKNIYIRIVLFLLIGSWLACSDSYKEEDFIEYDIPNDCALNIETGKVILVEDQATFNSIFEDCEANQISFEKYSLLLIKDEVGNDIDNISKDVEVRDDGTITLNVYIRTNYTCKLSTWYVAYLVKKPFTRKTALNIFYSME